MRLADASIARLGVTLLILAAASGTARAVDPSHLHGDWVGERQGRSVVWHLDGEGRLRLDGRPADYSIRGDTLAVSFDPSRAPGASGQRERAVYRFLVSLPSRGPARLFVYGFDLGAQGLWLEREAAPEPPLPEDTAPPVPGLKSGSAQAAPRMGSGSSPGLAAPRTGAPRRATRP